MSVMTDISVSYCTCCTDHGTCSIEWRGVERRVILGIYHRDVILGCVNTSLHIHRYPQYQYIHKHIVHTYMYIQCTYTVAHRSVVTAVTDIQNKPIYSHLCYQYDTHTQYTLWSPWPPPIPFHPQGVQSVG